ncbi:MAG: CoA ester lyase [Pseudomonadota bacterium]
MNRSFLFVPGDSERKFEKALSTNADAVIIDLEDSVAAARKPDARRYLAGFLTSDAAPQLWVRINPMDSDDCDEDLAALSPLPDGIVLPKCRGGTDIRELDGRLTSLESDTGRDIGSTRVLPLITERPSALFAVEDYAQVTDRLDALTWGAEDLAAALGANRNRGADGRWLPPYELARSLCLIGAAAADLPAVETVFTDIRDTAGAGRCATEARRDGFSGMLAIHPDQIDPINAAFTPTDTEISAATEIVARFDASPSAGVLQIEGRMIDRPHYLQARRLLGLAERAGKR